MMIGCCGNFIGLESLSQDNLAQWNKQTNRAVGNSAVRFLREMSYLPLGLIAKAAIPLNLSYRVRLTADGTMH